MEDLISRSTRGQFRQLMTDISSYRRVADALQDEGFAPYPDCTWDDSSVRRTATQQYLESVDWTDPVHVGRACRAFERLLAEWAPATADLQRSHNSPTPRRLHRRLHDRPDHPRPPTPPHFGRCGPWPRSPTSPPSRNNSTASSARSSTTPPWPSAAPRNSSRASPRSYSPNAPPRQRQGQPPRPCTRRPGSSRPTPSTSSPGSDGSDAVRKILGAVTTIATGLGEHLQREPDRPRRPARVRDRRRQSPGGLRRPGPACRPGPDHRRSPDRRVAADDRFAAAQADALDDAGRFAAHLHTTRILYLGHSFGGAALEACRTDQRCVGAADLDGTQYGPVVRNGLSKPMLLIGSENSCITGTCQPAADDQLHGHHRERPAVRQQWAYVVPPIQRRRALQLQRLRRVLPRRARPVPARAGHDRRHRCAHHHQCVPDRDRLPGVLASPAACWPDGRPVTPRVVAGSTPQRAAIPVQR
ncbi:hypothetical protein KUTG_00010 [Kutzneria sp. 744]|nr:hypothetical protein KUTG_00010 [Kutzneria sp. 744]